MCNGREWLERSGCSSSWIRREKRFAIYHRDHFDCVYCRMVFPPATGRCDRAAQSTARFTASDRYSCRSYIGRRSPTRGAIMPRVALRVLLTLREGYMFTDACKVLQMSPEQLRREIKLASQWIGFDRSNRR